MTLMMLCFRSQRKEEEAVALLKDSIRFGPHFADAYSSLASLYAEQVTQQKTQKEHTYVPHVTFMAGFRHNEMPYNLK